jgi:hypothetical protein
MHACVHVKGICHIARFVQVQASAAAVRKMHRVLRDAAFLDDLSRVLQARFITYNHPRETFCTIEIQISQGRNGAFHGQVLLFRHGWAASTTAVPLKGSCVDLGMLLTSLSSCACSSCKGASIK